MSNVVDDHHGVMEENVERQRNEIALLESMYPTELTVNRAPGSSSQACELEVFLEPDAYGLLFELSPRGYPQSAIPQVSLFCTDLVSRKIRKGFNIRLQEVLDRQEPGIECVDSIIIDFKDSVEDIRAEWESERISREEAQEQLDQHNEARKKEEREKHTQKKEAERKAKDEATFKKTPTEGVRIVLWMHHLLATSKRKAIVQNSKALSLFGFSKPGYPGAVYVEGEASNAKEFVDELKSMRWQAIQERGSESVPYSSLTLAIAGAPGIVEVESLGDIAEGLKKQNGPGPDIAEFFLECMKIK